MKHPDRREFLQSSAAGIGAAALAGSFPALASAADASGCPEACASGDADGCGNVLGGIATLASATVVPRCTVMRAVMSSVWYACGTARRFVPTCANGADATTLPAASSSAMVPRSPIARYDARIVSPAAPASRRAENDMTRATAAGATTCSGDATANDVVRETTPSGP